MKEFSNWEILINEANHQLLKEMQLRRVAFSTFLLGLSLYILLPTADEIVIHPVFGFLLSRILNLPLAYGILLSIVIYRGVGSACLIGSLFVGGKPIYHRLKERIGRKRKSNLSDRLVR